MSYDAPPSDRPERPQPGKQSALSTTREPFVPPRPVLDMVSGRVLDPGTALTVNGVRPRSTVYVGPRLIVSVAPGAADVVARLQEVATSLGWEAQVHPDDVEELRREKGEREVPGVVRLELTFEND